MADFWDIAYNVLDKAQKAFDPYEGDGVSYETDIGAVFKKHFKIDKYKVQWGSDVVELKDVTGVSFGVSVTSYNGIKTTEYLVIIRHPRGRFQIDIKKKKKYLNIIRCLWNSVGVRLITEFAIKLAQGESFTYDGMTISNLGVVLTEKRFFKTTSSFYTWDQVSCNSANGYFCIWANDNTKAVGAVSYMYSDAHVVSALIKTVIDRKLVKVSDLLR